MCGIEADVVQLLDADNFRTVSSEVILPVVRSHYHTPIFSSCKLCGVHRRRLIHHTNKVRQSAHLGPPVALLHQAKAPVWAELCVPWHHEGQSDLLVLAGHDSLQQVLDHGGVLILPTTVIGVQVYPFLSQSMVCKVVMEHADDGI